LYAGADVADIDLRPPPAALLELLVVARTPWKLSDRSCPSKQKPKATTTSTMASRGGRSGFKCSGMSMAERRMDRYCRAEKAEWKRRARPRPDRIDETGGIACRL